MKYELVCVSYVHTSGEAVVVDVGLPAQEAPDHTARVGCDREPESRPMTTGGGGEGGGTEGGIVDAGQMNSNRMSAGTEPSETVWHAMPHVRPMPPELQLESSYNIALGDDTPQVIRKYTFAVE